MRGSLLWGFPASLPRAYPRFTGSFLGPLPQLPKLIQGQCSAL